MTTVEWLQKMREAGIPQQQAEAIASGVETNYVTRDYLDSRLAQLLNDITWRIIGLAVVVVSAVGLLDKLVRP